MTAVVVELRNVAGTEAAVGWVGTHAVVVDRPEGVAGGAGLGFNGGQLLALAIGGCLCNELRYAAHAMRVALAEVTRELDGTPAVAVAATVQVDCRTPDGEPAEAVVARALAESTIANSVGAGLPFTLKGA
ncbi:MAG TPA: OsmC family protein [Amaricoccus sp.]|nr:OsmC family protein [Amaricoccus sp.]